jgi:hypothetical protein
MSSRRPHPKKKSKKTAKPQPRQEDRQHKPQTGARRILIEAAKFWLPIIGAGIFITWGITAWYSGGKVHAIWLLFGGAVCLLLLGAIQWQEDVSKPNEAEARKPTETEMALTRAHVSIVSSEVIHTPGKAPIITLVLKNTGKTIARDVTWRAQFTLAPLDATLPLDIKVPTSKQDLPPDGVLSYRYVFEPWDPAWEGSLKSEAVDIIAFGYISYSDIYGHGWPSDYRLISGGAYDRKGGITRGSFGVPPQRQKE